MSEMMTEHRGFIRTWKCDNLDWLIHEKPDALRLLILIQTRARFTDGWNPLGLKKNQAVVGLGDVAKWGWTQSRYRTAKKALATAQACHFKGINKGTIVTLLNEVAYVDESPENCEQVNHQTANESRSIHDQNARETRLNNKEIIEEEKKKDTKGVGVVESNADDGNYPCMMTAYRRSPISRAKLDSSKYEDYPNFMAWWNLYPCGKSKRKALRVWIRQGLESEDQESLLLALRKVRCSHQWKKDEGAYIPHASTYLNERRYEDEVKEPNRRDERPRFAHG